MHAKIVQTTKVKENGRKRMRKDVRLVVEKLLKDVEEMELAGGLDPPVFKPNYPVF